MMASNLSFRAYQREASNRHSMHYVINKEIASNDSLVKSNTSAGSQRVTTNSLRASLLLFTWLQLLLSPKIREHYLEHIINYYRSLLQMGTVQMVKSVSIRVIRG